MTIGYTLRPYQQEAVNMAMEYIKKNSEPAVLSLCTGAGKSLICAELARLIHGISGKKILCLCPSAELIKQNFEKFLLTGYQASIYSASISKSLRHDVIFATEGTFKSVAERVGSEYAAVIIDECHKITPTIKKIISNMKKSSPNLRVIGLTATPYRLLSGFIYSLDEFNNVVDEAINPYFKKLLYTVSAEHLISLGFLTRPVAGNVNAESYDTSNLTLNKTGNFDSSDIDKAFVGHGRKTAVIIGDIVDQSKKSTGVMIFCATVQHAKEAMASLPQSISALITGETPKKERDKIINDFKSQKIKYLTNCSVLTTGFDAPNVDTVAILRATESASLLTQIIGRSLRLFDGKDKATILDYAGNIERFFPDGDLFNPTIKAYGQKPPLKGTFKCEKCQSKNEVSLRPNPDGFLIDEYGYFCDLKKQRIMVEKKPFPAHFGRRCTHVEAKGKNVFERCDYFWSCKVCPACEHDNDIAARFCTNCKHELIDPSDKLVGEFKALKRDPRQTQTDEVLNMIVTQNTSKNGNKMLRVKFETPYRMFQTFFMINSENQFLMNRYKKFMETTQNGLFPPKTVTYKKNKKDLFEVYDYNQPTDKDQLDIKMEQIA